MKNNNKIIYSILLLLGMAAVIYWRWASFAIFTSGDWPYYPAESFHPFTYSFMWLSLNDMGVTNIIAWRSILATGQSIFAVFGFGSNVSEKMLTFWPTLLFANVFSFLLFKKVLKSNLGAVVGSIVFNYSTYYITASSAFLLFYLLQIMKEYYLNNNDKSSRRENKLINKIKNSKTLIASNINLSINAYLGLFL